MRECRLLHKVQECGCSVKLFAALLLDLLCATSCCCTLPQLALTMLPGTVLPSLYVQVAMLLPYC
jgi:hypothetical protein